MLFIKKLILISALGGGITIPTIKAVSYTEPDEKLLEYDAITKKWNRLLKKIPQVGLSKKLSSLFSANLTTFAKIAIENTVKQLLVNWIIEIWNNPDHYFPISHRLNKFFSDYQLSYWKIKNDVDELSWELIKNFFIDFFFKEKGWMLLSQYGDFRTFALNNWIEQEKPMMIYEWNIDYSSPTENSKIYTEEIMKTKSSNDPYLWPELTYSEQYAVFMSKFKNTNKVDLNSFSKKIYTISDLKTLEDGYKLGTLLHLLTYVGSDWNTTSPENINSLSLAKSSQTEREKDSYLESPLFLFLQRQEEESGSIDSLAKSSDCSLIKNSIFKTEFSKKISNYDWTKPDYHFFSSDNYSCLYGLRELKNNLRPNEKLFASRETKGISLYYLPHHRVKYSIDTLTPDVSQKFEKYLKDNFETIFFKYLNAKNSSIDSFQLKLSKSSSIAPNIGKWNFSEHYKKYQDLLNAALEYRDTLYWMQNIYEFQRILATTYSTLPTKILLKNIKLSTQLQPSDGNGANNNSSWKIQLQPSDGLFSPLPFKRTSDEKTEEQEIKFSDLRNEQAAKKRRKRSSEANNRKNDGFFSHLLNPLNVKNSFYSLEEAAHKLKQKLSEKITTADIKNLFLNDLFLRAQLEKLSEEKTLSEFSLFKLWTEKLLFNKNQNQENTNDMDFSQMISSYSSSLLKPKPEGSQNNDWNNLIEKTMFLEKYLNLPIEEKIIFGSYKHDFEQSSQENQKKIKISNDENNKNISMKSKNSWILKNYYLSDSAYESASEEYRNFLSYLYSIYWMTKNNYENLPLLISSIFKKDENKNAYLVWFKEINEQELSSLKSEEIKQVNGDSNDKNLPQLFDSKISNDILNPLLMGKTILEIKNTESGSEQEAPKNDSTQELQFNAENTLFKVQGYTKKNQETSDNKESNNKVELAGFAGLITSKFSTREIPKVVKDTIFNSFWLNNDSSNTNYSSTQNSSNNGTLEGIFFEDNNEKEFQNNEELKKFLLGFKSKSKLQKYLNSEDSTRPYPKLLTALTSLWKENNEKEIEDLTFQDLREQIEKVLKNNIQQIDSSPQGASENWTNLYQMWNRFSGYLYNGKNQQYPYVLNTQEGGKTKYYVVFLYQVNKFDFEKDKIQKLKENISDKTLHSMISLLASNKEVSEWIYKFDLANKLSLF